MTDPTTSTAHDPAPRRPRDTAFAEQMRREHPEDRCGFLIRTPAAADQRHTVGLEFDTVEAAEAYIAAHPELPAGTDVMWFVSFGDGPGRTRAS